MEYKATHRYADVAPRKMRPTVQLIRGPKGSTVILTILPAGAASQVRIECSYTS